MDPHTGIVLMTAGGNNVGFASVIANCFVEFAWSMAKCTNQVNAAESKADSTLQETTTFLSHIQNRLADPTHARVILGYPYLVQAGRDTPATKGLFINEGVGSAVRGCGVAAG